MVNQMNDLPEAVERDDNNGCDTSICSERDQCSSVKQEALGYSSWALIVVVSQCSGSIHHKSHHCEHGTEQLKGRMSGRASRGIKLSLYIVQESIGLNGMQIEKIENTKVEASRLSKGRMIRNVETAGVHLCPTSKAETSEDQPICQYAQHSNGNDSHVEIYHIPVTGHHRRALSHCGHISTAVILSLELRGHFVLPVNSGHNHDQSFVKSAVNARRMLRNYYNSPETTQHDNDKSESHTRR